MRADLVSRARRTVNREAAEAMPDFVLDPQLEADSIRVADLPLSAVRLTRDANYPWLLLVPRRPGLAEIIDLDRHDRASLMEEIALASEALKSTVACDKLNVAALGNMVRQLHVHVIARHRDDPAWPRPVFGATPASRYADGAAEALAEKLAARLK
jgi:diadenosine tetraphosphate (Ap4A) HIT family hydrolase